MTSPTLAIATATREVSENEERMLNFYRASELHGGLILGQVARRTRDAILACELLRHSAEEIEHARVWTETIRRVGAKVQPVRSTYQTRYADAAGHPISMLHVLALTQVFERRVYRHFTEHLRRPGTHPVVQSGLRRMLEEEKGHLRWVKEWLYREAVDRGRPVREIMRHYADLDQRIYDALAVEYGWRSAA